MEQSPSGFVVLALRDGDIDWISQNETFGEAKDSAQDAAEQSTEGDTVCFVVVPCLFRVDAAQLP